MSTTVSGRSAIPSPFFARKMAIEALRGVPKDSWQSLTRRRPSRVSRPFSKMGQNGATLQRLIRCYGFFCFS